MADEGEGRNPDMLLRLSVDSPPSEAFQILVRQIADSLARIGLHLEPRSGGILKEGEFQFGTVAISDPGTSLDIILKPANWIDSPAASIRLLVEKVADGSRVDVELSGWKGVLKAVGGDLIDWTAVALVPAILRQLSPQALADWVVDQQARRPSGESAKVTYRDPTYHWPNFLLILDRIRLTAEDRLLEVACGGGAFLHRALESGCSAIGVDHSPEMVRLAREVNRAAIEAGRLRVVEADANNLPVEGDSFTSCVCTGAFNFFPDPARVLQEMHRALAPGGRLAIFMETAAARGTPAAPEPFASQSRFYEPSEIRELAREAGFSEVVVEEPDLGPFARAARIPDDAAKLFEGTTGALLLFATKPTSTSGDAPPPLLVPEPPVFRRVPPEVESEF